MSQSTYDKIKEFSEYLFVNRGKIQAKGKGDIEMFFVDIKRPMNL
ncbi:MAG: hypothetical protein DA408_12915 [Bacteroidetes bacterium]|nr:MAG: hypothetical protein DA408_12915 [Bacteroidota bacterium]